MSRSLILPQGTYPIGTRTLGPVTIPLGVTFVALELAGAAMTNPALALTVTLDLSLDGGTTWASVSPSTPTDPFPVIATMEGGMLNKQGTFQDPYYLSVTGIPAPTNANRRVRATVVIAGASLTTAITLVLT